MTPHADGPDISHYQTITGQPVDPAWSLCAHKCSEGRTSGDATFPARWQWMRDQGFKFRGAYHWLRTDSSIAAQAANLCARIDALGGLRRGEFVQCDWERTSNLADPTPAQTAEWCDRVEQHYGRACVIVYCSDWLPGFAAWRQQHPDFPLWYANYSTSDRPSGGWAECAKYGADVWQWTSSFVHPSIGGRFDMNHVVDFATLYRITDQAPAPEPEPTPPVVAPEEDDMPKLIIEEAHAGGASFYWDGTPMSGEVRAALEAEGGWTVVKQNHEHWWAAVSHRNGVEAAVLFEQFRAGNDNAGAGS